MRNGWGLCVYGVVVVRTGVMNRYIVGREIGVLVNYKIVLNDLIDFFFCCLFTEDFEQVT